MATTSSMDIWRSKFPRLYFLSDYEVVELLSKEKDFTNMQPWVCRIFAGIQEIQYSLPSEQLHDLSFGELKAVEGEFQSQADDVEEIIVLISSN
jgi:hypothetical protein